MKNIKTIVSILCIISFSGALSFAKKTKDLSRKPNSENSLENKPAKKVFNLLPGKSSTETDWVISKRSSINCYEVGPNNKLTYSCELDDNSKIKGATAKLLFDQIPSEPNNDGDKKLQKTGSIICYENSKNPKSVYYFCDLSE